MKSLRPAFVLCALGLALATRVAADNAALAWNEEAVDATRLSRYPAPYAALLYATYHVAIFDAVNGIDRTYHGWLVDEPAPAGANMDAAVASAAYTVLDALWAATNPRTEQIFYENALAKVPDGQSKADGIAWGRKVALAVLAKRANCGFDKAVPGKYTSSDQGKWRETPPGFRPPVLPYWGRVTPFVMTSPAQFRAPPPETLGSKAYAEELAFVANHGGRDEADRTEYQTMCTPFWSDDLGTATPAGHWNVIAQGIARSRNMSEVKCARLFALVNMAAADAGISAWETKYYYNTWRPETALRELDPKLNPRVELKPDFIPNMSSPAFPSYISGHSTYSSACARMIALVIGTDDADFSVTSDGLPGAVHTFKKLSDAQREVGMSRVWGGIHTMSDNLEAQKVGVNVADWVYSHALLPLSK